jgi:hypothetical protein
MDPNTSGLFIALTIIGIMFAVGLSFYYIKVGAKTSFSLRVSFAIF